MNLQLFQFDEARQMRAFLDTDGTPWMCGADLTRALGYKNGPQAVADNCAEKGISRRYTPTAGGTQLLTWLNEGNVFRLIMKSKMPEATAFQDWVCDEVLPQIRRTGSYNPAAVAMPQTLPEALRLYADSLDREGKLAVQLAEAAPKVDYYDLVADSKEATPMADVAKIIALPHIGRNIMFKKLRDMKILQGNNRPYQVYIDRGYFRVVQSTYLKSDGTSGLTYTTMVYQKGIEFIASKLKAA